MNGHFFFSMDHLSGFSLDASFHQLSSCRIYSHLSRDVHSPIYQDSLAGRQKGTRLNELRFWVIMQFNDLIIYFKSINEYFDSLYAKTSTT